MNKKISIITASYNYEKYISETIESVINQTYTNWELIIIDDGSKDNSIEVIKSYCEKDNRIKLYTHENNVNKGLVETLKLGISKATTEWIAFLESDDTFVPNCLEEKVKVIEKHPETALVFSDVNMFGNDELINKNYSRHFERVKKVLDKQQFPTKNLLKYFTEENLIPTFSVVAVKKSELEKCDFNVPYSKAILDYYLWIQLADKYIYYIDKKLSNWRMHDNSYIHSANSFYIEFAFRVMLMNFRTKNTNVSILFTILFYIKRLLLRIKSKFIK